MFRAGVEAAAGRVREGGHPMGTRTLLQQHGHLPAHRSVQCC